MAKKTDKENSWCCCNSKSWGWVLVIIGVYLLATHLGWIPKNLPFWPIVLIIFGVYLLRIYKK